MSGASNLGLLAIVLASCAPRSPSTSTAIPPSTDAQADVVAMTDPWQDVTARELCVTSGTLDARGATSFGITSPTFRAVTRAQAPGSADLSFTYVGETRETRALGSGAIRRQIGLKLRAQDPCNLVYVIWRFEPVSEVVVSIKRNVGKSTSAECGNRGYTNLSPIARGSFAAIKPGDHRTLSTRLEGSRLDVLIDNVVVWSGELPADSTALRGPVGVRSDNVEATCELRVLTTTSASTGEGINCPSGEAQD